MNKTQAKMLIKAVRTDLEMFECTEQGYYLERAISCLKVLVKWKNERAIKSYENTIQNERFLWTLIY